MKPLATLLLILLLSASLLAGGAGAASVGWRSAGVRGGFSADGMHQYDAFADYGLPLSWRSRGGWGVNVLLDLSAGMLQRRRDYGFIGSFGPLFAIGRSGLPFEIIMGVSTAIINRDTFGDRDYNGVVQFLSYVGLHWRLPGGVGAWYRFEHLSNAGLNGHRNPGSNLSIFGLSWEFDEAAAVLP